MIKLTHRIVWIVLAATFIPSLLAQTNTPPVLPIASSSSDLWTLAISAVSPVIVWVIAKLNVPVNLLPVLSPLVGVVLGVGLNWLAGTHLGWVDMAKAGALAVFIRETINQNITKRLQPSQDSTTTKP